jgi:hypothetical protein
MSQSKLGRLGKPRNCITNLLERLLLLVLLSLAITEDFSGQVIADNTVELLVLYLEYCEINPPDFVILVALKTLVGDRVNVHGGLSGLAGQFTQFLAKDLLQVVGEVVLGAEEDNTTLRD